jgi:hypothetical protein
MTDDGKAQPILEELLGACAHSEESDNRRLDEWPLIMHLGYPAPAAPGTVALKLADVVTVLREADVLRVEKHKSLYRVWTSSDANVIIRLEKVAKAGGDADACPCENRPAETSIAREITIEIGPVTVLSCQTQRICTTVFGRPYCYNVVVCRGEGLGEPIILQEE